ncbi:hypothetical protein L211DRAFT_840910 [Terfezia boudieri ATCC MYA-4762]|uniref:Uncharacterized protein n=1 Tax=Terfezia boudieri ATCC MYA-4762 TaxID=1051890 RepID=A0A3N4LI88_9PEZI|nr:hypothetical protein L211DRAFT_840910 [Terfezia boudieri ATCC MYA-4762]
MPRLTQRRVLLNNIWGVIERLIQVLKELPGDDIILELLDEVLGVYRKISMRRYFEPE